MAILKDKPESFYLYEVIAKNNPHKDQLGRVIRSRTNDLNPKFYKFIGTQRYAFVGDMQADFDKYYQRNNMRHFAVSVKPIEPYVLPRRIIKYRKPVSLYRRIKRRILIYFRDRRASNYFNDLFNNKQ